MRESIQSAAQTYALQQSAHAIKQTREAKKALDQLVRRVIQNELSEQDRLLIRLHWYQGKSAEELAALTGLDRSTVYRRLEQSHKTIYDKLKYAVDCRFDPPFREQVKSTLQNAGQSTFAIEALDLVGTRLTQLRQQKRLSFSDVHRATGISPSRLRELEADGRQMMMTELSALSRLYGVGVSSLLFGADGRESFC